MADPAPSPSRALAMGKTIAKFAAAWALALSLPYSSWVRASDVWIQNAIYKIFAGFPAAAEMVDRAYQDYCETLAIAFAVTLFFASLLAPLGAATRMLARARVRAGHLDFLERVRRWTSAHPLLTRALLSVPALLWATVIMRPGHYELRHAWTWAGSLLAGGLGIFAMTRKGLRELLAPTMGDVEATRRREIGPDEVVFDAVAVTRRTLAMVGVFTAVTLAVPTFIATRPILQLFQERSIFYFVFAYIAFAAVGALAFRKASHVAVGVDGIHVRGTAKARFFAYRDIDTARVKGGDIELVRRGRVVLRLQLHGEDAARRDAVLARIHENLERVREGRGAIAAQLVASSSKDHLARVAQGAADYRMATLTREQLWALVEGPEVEASARTAAAEALATSGDLRERSRLRVAAEHCAEPHVRVALQEIAGLEEPEARSARAARVV